jgi:CubicO group peptidase (beta-lactamase class C family)
MSQEFRWLALGPVLAFVTLVTLFAASGSASRETSYYPPAGEWAHKKPSEVGMDAGKLKAAIAFLESHETTQARDFSDQEIMFGKLLGSMPTERAATNGLIIRHGYVVAEFGEVTRPDPTYSVAKSMLSTVAGIALRQGLIEGIDDPVANTIKDGGYDSPHNRQITWRHHLQQASEWEGEMFGRNANFVGREDFGNAEMKPRATEEPGTHYEYNDVRLNRLSLSLLEVFKTPIPEVFRNEVMDPIGASNTWKWVPYVNSYVSIDGKSMPSVSGGTRWGGGVWINSFDMARFGLLWLRGGKWGNRQIIPESYVKAATTPGARKSDYGLLWWLNSGEWGPANAYQARGSGGNIIHIDPTNDLVVVWRWSDSESFSQGLRLVLQSIVK